VRVPLTVTLLAAALGCGPATQNPGGQGEPGTAIPSCEIEADGLLSPDEMPLAPDIAIRYVRNEPGTTVDVDLDGEPWGDARLWDFSEGPADVGSTLVTADPTVAWYADEFPDATFAAPLLVELPELLAVQRWAPDGAGGGELQLLGLATTTEQEPASTTLVRYDAPVTLLRLPMAVGDVWGQQATFRDARIAGIPNAGVEDYLFEVESAGSAVLPNGIEVDEVLRVRSRVDATYAIALGEPTSSLHRLSWYAPCFGEIASVSGGDEGLQPADELRRYYP
jgi:hypothetical protein